MFVSGCPYPTNIVKVPAYVGGDGAVVTPRGEGQRPHLVPTQRTDGVFAYTRSQVTALGRNTREL